MREIDGNFDGLFFAECVLGPARVHGETVSVPVSGLFVLGRHPLASERAGPYEGELVFDGAVESRRKLTEYIGDSRKPDGFKPPREEADTLTNADSENEGIQEFGMEAIKSLQAPGLTIGASTLSRSSCGCADPGELPGEGRRQAAREGLALMREYVGRRSPWAVHAIADEAAPLTAEGDSSPSRREGRRDGPTGRRRRLVATSVITKRPDPAWYTLDADPSAPLRLLDDEGRPAPGLADDAQRALADLAAQAQEANLVEGERPARSG